MTRTRATVCRIEPQSRAYIFAAQENRAFDRVFDRRVTASRTESLMDASLLAGSGRSRIVGCCNRLGRVT
jgi:hypothetical protein